MFIATRQFEMRNRIGQYSEHFHIAFRHGYWFLYKNRFYKDKREHAWLMATTVLTDCFKAIEEGRNQSIKV